MSNIREVAKLAQVATCTVSRVINGNEAVAEATRLKVLKAMEELDYIPNELARGMFKQKAGIVSMLVPSIKHPFFSSLADCIEEELYHNGYKLMLCSTGGDVDKEREYMTTFRSNIVDGVIMGVNTLENSIYEAFAKPLIMLDYLVNSDIPVVVSDHQQGGYLAAQCFIRSHCKKVIHITSSDSHTVLSYESHKMLEEELLKQGISSRAVDIKWNEFDFDGYHKMAKMILIDNPDVDGIMAADLPALAFQKAAVELGKSIPDDLAIVAYDGTYVVKTNQMEMTRIEQPLHEIAKEAVRLLLKKINGKNIKENVCVKQVHLVQGNTTL